MTAAALTLATLALATPAQAQIIPRSMEVDVGAGYYWFVSNLENLKSGPAFGGRVGVQFVEFLGVEATAHYVPTATWHGSRISHVVPVHMDLVIHTTPWRVIPYFAVGAGFQYWDITEDWKGGVEPDPAVARRDPWATDARIAEGDLKYRKHDTDFLFDVGGGLKFLIFDRGGIRLDARYALTIGAETQDEGVPAWIEQADGTEEVQWNGRFHHVQLSGSMFFLLGGGAGKDTDKDGLPDRKDTCPGEAEDKDGYLDDDGCPDRDDDSDGVFDEVDGCRADAEDKDGYRDSDGCPDPDNDEDGLKDGEDGCPDKKEDLDSFQDSDGCPDPDNDSDGILDERDACAIEAEDRDGFRDDDGCPEPDNDGDSVLDIADRCPDAPEQKNGIDDQDGCPEIDADMDGVYDERDRCPEGKEDLDGFQDEDGCPDPDNDGDGVIDREDSCPMAPEDPDGWEDGDGCSENDNDDDGIPDGRDSCPDKAEDDDGFEDNNGCPEFDNDGDGVLDGKDRCANHPETMNGFEDEDGCPDELPETLKKFTGVIPDIQFKVDSDELLSSSYAVLNQAAAVLSQYASVRMEIQGHASSEGEDQHNLELSQRRAESVKRYLSQQGVGADRLTAVGYGEAQPIDTNKTDAGRARNRRVEFKILQQ